MVSRFSNRRAREMGLPPRPRSKPTPNTDPWRLVMPDPAPALHEGRGGLLGPDTARRTRWWEMVLDCGHRVERTVRYSKVPSDDRYRYGNMRSGDDVLPPPRRVRCEHCGAERRRETAP